MVPSYDGSQIAERASRQFLCAQIDHNHRITRRLEQDLRHRRTVLAESMREWDLSILDSLKMDVQKKEEEKCKSRQKRKFDALMRSAQHWGGRTRPEQAQRSQRSGSEEHPRWVVNLSSRSLSVSEHALLQKGLNFAPAPSRLPTARIVAAVECGLRGVSEEKAELARTRIVGAIANARPPPVNLLPQERKAIKTLQEDDRILVLPADKGRATVVMDRAQYDEKMNSLLDDRKTYKRLTKDPTPSIERKMNALLLQLKRKGAITDDQYSKLRSSAGRLPLLYGLPKVHKPTVPLRPIVSFVHSPTYQLSKYLARILSPLVGNSPSHVRNSYTFTQFARAESLQEGELLVSFDVVSLFTNVPVDLAMTVARQRLQVDGSLAERTSLSVDEIMKLLELCLSATFMAFRGSMFQQTFGTAMGSPVSVTIANLVMEDVEERALATAETPPRFWKRYVDDTCTALPSHRIDEFLNHLNSVEPSIQFTVEVESNGRLPFLDVLLEHEEDGSISTTVYRKPTHTDRYLDFSSHHPLAHKIAVVKTLHGRAEAISSSVVHKDSEIRHVRRALGTNGYPRGVVERYSGTTRAAHEDNQMTRGPPITLPYVRGISEAVRRILRPLGVRVTFKPTITLKQLLVKPKDQVPDRERANVVYQVPCANCPATYVGQTGRRLNQRLREHRRAVESGDCANSALAEHAWGCHHPVDWDHVRVLDGHPPPVPETDLRVSAH